MKRPLCSLQQLIDREWAYPSKARDNHRPSAHLCTLAQEDMRRLKLPLVDAPVAALGAPSILLSDSEGFPRDVADKRIETAARRCFDAFACALKVTISASLFSRAAWVWINDLVQKYAIPNQALSELKKISLASAFASDATAERYSMECQGNGM